MKKEIGLWIDHRETVLVTLQYGREEVRKIESDMEKHIRFSSGNHSDSPSGSQGSLAEDMRDRQFGNHLDVYYDRIIALIHDADSILIFGPGEAKVELENRLQHANLGAKIVAIETADKMTVPQVSAKVTSYYLKK